MYSIGFFCALGGLQVRAYDPSEQTLIGLRANIEADIAELCSDNVLNPPTLTFSVSDFYNISLSLSLYSPFLELLILIYDL